MKMELQQPINLFTVRSFLDWSPQCIFYITLLVVNKIFNYIHRKRGN